jgi:hypothetical protein
LYQAVKDIKSKGLKLKVEYNTNDYLSCEILFDKAQAVKDIKSKALKLKVEYNTKDYLSCEILFDRAPPDEEN